MEEVCEEGDDNGEDEEGDGGWEEADDEEGDGENENDG